MCIPPVPGSSCYVTEAPKRGVIFSIVRKVKIPVPTFSCNWRRDVGVYGPGLILLLADDFLTLAWSLATTVSFMAMQDSSMGTDLVSNASFRDTQTPSIKACKNCLCAATRPCPFAKHAATTEIFLLFVQMHLLWSVQFEDHRLWS